MRKSPVSLRRAAMVALVFTLVAVSVAIAVSFPAPWGGLPKAVASTTVTVPVTPTTSPTTTTTATTSTTTTEPAAPGGLIAIGPSRNQCLEPNFINTGLASLQAAITSFDTDTNSSVTCVSAYLTSALTWTQWVHPWITASKYGYASWVAEKPQIRQLVLQVNLIPNYLKNVNNPLSWERSCAAGHFNRYATQLGKNLVAAGLQNSVIRLGAEMNGIWEADFVGTTTVEQKLWATCFANEVTGLRRVAGEHFLIDWNPNACKENIPYEHFYPGNAYVDILGLDLFDMSCVAPKTPYTFTQLAREPVSLAYFEAFATAKGKPMSLPEWGLTATPVGDDPLYIAGIGSTIASGNFAFETYFDANLVIRSYLPLGSRTPLSLAAFKKWFGAAGQTPLR